MLQDLAQAAQERQAQAEAKRETAAVKDDMLQGLEQAALERQALAEAKREIAAAAQDGKTPRYCRHLGCILPRVPAISSRAGILAQIAEAARAREEQEAAKRQTATVKQQMLQEVRLSSLSRTRAHSNAARLGLGA